MNDDDIKINDIQQYIRETDIHEIAAGIKKSVTAGGGKVCVEVIDDDTICVKYP